MKRQRIYNHHTAIDASLAVTMVAGIGTDMLADGFLAAMHGVLPLTFCTVFALATSGRVATVSTASSYGDAALQTSERYVNNRFDLLDPNMIWLAKRKLPKQPQLWLSHQKAEEVADPAYRAACYGEVGIRERVSVLLLLPAGQRAAVSFYRSLAQPAFTDADLAVVASFGPLLAEATKAHGRGMASPAGAGTGLGKAQEAPQLLALSAREREVIALLLVGQTAKDAARVIGVALSTVRTHQYRAFRRLGIKTLKELLLAYRQEGDLEILHPKR